MNTTELNNVKLLLVAMKPTLSNESKNVVDEILHLLNKAEERSHYTYKPSLDELAVKRTAALDHYRHVWERENPHLVHPQYTRNSQSLDEGEDEID